MRMTLRPFFYAALLDFLANLPYLCLQKHLRIPELGKNHAS